MAISTQISRLMSLRDAIRTKLIGLGILPAVSTSATLSQCYDALSGVTALGAMSYTPTTAAQTIPSGRYLSGVQTINAIPSAYIIPSGTITLSSSGTFDVGSYASADVTVTGGPSGNYLDYIYYTDSDASAVFHLNINNTKLPVGLFMGPKAGALTTFGYGPVIGGYISNPNSYLFQLGLSTFFKCSVYRDGLCESFITCISGGRTFQGTTIASGLYTSSLDGKPIIFSRLSFIYGTGVFEGGIGQGRNFSNTLSFPALTTISGSSVFYNAAGGDRIHASMILYFPALVSISGFNLFGNNNNSYYFGALSVIPPSTSSMFTGMESGGAIHLPEIREIYGSNTFYNAKCTIDIGSKLTNIYSPSCFYNAPGITEITDAKYPSLYAISGSGAFRDCTNLSIVSLSGIYSLRDTGIFSGCTGLETLSLPILSRLSNNVFYGCTKLSRVYLPSLNYSSAWTLNSSCFRGCTSLNTISFPRAVGLSGSNMFASCYNLISVFLLGSSLCSLAGTVANIFSSTPVSTYSTSAGRFASIFVPSSLLASYKAATNWTTISSKIFAYEDYFDAQGNPL